ncbi:uncharacterized protein LOC103945006 isoform X2 [Pyrus x bretschneideri]|uniref:uncharacterized protein LOC103945006 isoform X1 n=1 Tax=Pyrus x bretschneideri TaxID=225117 RepID=UPI00202E7126|nr:uncharacterized protein LOC103945006 isoform X1 [Pyrus x bretschneideri]XP_048433881.1 uncharacterized protein LOC103945006 isoform X2 [Pyrus x bretschneideri]XP_048433882.1 uncharacterized protein LOC103945006 isoform X2 [Pyrus x bretschneideri]
MSGDLSAIAADPRFHEWERGYSQRKTWGPSGFEEEGYLAYFRQISQTLLLMKRVFGSLISFVCLLLCCFVSFIFQCWLMEICKNGCSFLRRERERVRSTLKPEPGISLLLLSLYDVLSQFLSDSDEDSGDEEEMAKEEDQNALSVRIIDALNSRKSALHHSLIIW